MSFEGSEKKIEIVFKQEIKSLRDRHSLWDRVVRKAKAGILNRISGDKCDAFLLSESSLFVYDTKMVMITCGQTSLINAVVEIFRAISIEDVELLVYERKNEVFPELQSSSFEQDTEVLKSMMPGQVFYFGGEGGNQVKLFHLEKDFKPVPKDLTLEILMHGLDEKVSPLFNTEVSTLERLRRDTGINSIIPGFQTDDYLFEPWGYSINAIKEHAYFTSHVTPEHGYSYASFETNYYLKESLGEVIKKVLRIFNPDRFAVVLFEPAEKSYKLDLGTEATVEQTVDLKCGYRFHFLDFKNESKGEKNGTLG